MTTTTGQSAKPLRRLGTHWERQQLQGARLLAAAMAIASLLLGLALRSRGVPLWFTVTAALSIGLAVYWFGTRKVRRRRRILAEPFPPEWDVVLQGDVIFYRALPEQEKARFRREIQIFIGEKQITGINAVVDDATLVLTAASAVIPIFGFPEWEWDQISEVLIYPSRFTDEFAQGKGGDHNVLGMVGTGSMNRLMILSKPDLLAGFRNPGDKRNVGIHEFAHLVDKSDGVVDGLPSVGLDRAALGPWVELVRRKLREIEAGDSDIRRYALTNEAEFFAVVTEYFFERPGIMQRKHPELYEALQQVFQQNLRQRATAIAKEIGRGRQRFGRNSPCPCGSGRKYKKCCLK